MLGKNLPENELSKSNELSTHRKEPTENEEGIERPVSLNKFQLDNNDVRCIIKTPKALTSGQRMTATRWAVANLRKGQREQ